MARGCQGGGRTKRAAENLNVLRKTALYLLRKTAVPEKRFGISRKIETAADAAGYKFAEMTYPTDPKKRVQGFPTDALHQACASHNTRLRNILRSPGIEMLEKALLKQRAVNMKAAQGAYVEKQRRALSA